MHTLNFNLLLKILEFIISMGNICSNQIFEESQKRKTFQFNYILDTIPEEEEYETDSCYDRAPKKSNFSGKSC